MAAEQAAEILKVVPGHPLAALLLGVARRRSGDPAASQGILEPLAQAQPNWAAAQYELGVTLGARGSGEAAIVALKRAVSLKPDMPDAWRALGDHLTARRLSHDRRFAVRFFTSSTIRHARSIEPCTRAVSPT